MADNDKKEVQIRAEERFNEQCFLIDNWQELARRNEQDTRSKKDQYKNFTILYGDPADSLHDLVGRKGIDVLMELTPAQIALLIPKIKISKISYESEKDSKTPKSGVEKVLVLNDHTTKTSIDKILTNRQGRGEDAGLKSFTYKFAGKNPAEGGTAEAQLKLHFQNVATLVKRPPDRKQAAFIDLILAEPRKLKKIEQECYEDPFTRTNTHPSRIWNPKHFRIKIEAGWALPEDPTESLFDANLKKAISKSTTVLLMDLKSHELDFQENGVVDLTVNYQATLEGAMSRPESDIFAPSFFGRQASRLEESKKAQTQAKSPTNQDKPKADLPPASDPSKGRTVEVSASGASQESKDESKILMLQGLDKQVRWSRILDGLQKSSKLYYVDVDEQHIVGFTEDQKDKLEDLENKFDDEQKKTLKKALREQNRRVTTSKELSRGISRLKIVRMINSKRDPVENKELRGTLETIKEITKVDYSKNFFRTKHRYSTKSREEINETVLKHEKTLRSVIPSDKGVRRIYFFYFGDLLEIALNVLNSKGREDNLDIKVLLGTIAVWDPRNQKQSSPHMAALADIPISLNLFQAWYMKNVVAQQRERYYLKQFLIDVMEKMIFPALGETCFLGAEKSRHHVSMTTFTLPGIGAKKDKNPFEKVGSRQTTAMVKQSVGAGDLRVDTPDVSVDKLLNFMYIFVSNWPMRGLVGNRKEDHKKGIYHFTVGADRGLVKRIKFKKQDQPYIAEERATSDSADNKRLRDRYNATVEMIGNNLFRPGMYIYIDTASMSNDLGSSTKEQSIAYQLGLGGYYQIKEVNCITDKDTFDTELECQWIHAGDVDAKNSCGHTARKVLERKRYWMLSEARKKKISDIKDK